MMNQTKTEVKITKQSVPLREDGHGGLRVGATRVTLEGVIYAWKNGATAEDIRQSYDTLQLADIYAVIAFYLTHETEVEAYLQRREKESEEMCAEIEARHDQAALVKKLQARHAQMTASAVLKKPRAISKRKARVTA